MKKEPDIKWKSRYYNITCNSCKHPQIITLQDFSTGKYYGSPVLYLKAQCEKCEMLFTERDKTNNNKPNFEIENECVGDKKQRIKEVLPPPFFDTSDDSVFSIRPFVGKGK